MPSVVYSFLTEIVARFVRHYLHVVRQYVGVFSVIWYCIFEHNRREVGYTRLMLCLKNTALDERFIRHKLAACLFYYSINNGRFRRYLGRSAYFYWC